MKKDLFLCFIDYKKAFDKVKHNEMICVLDQIGIDDKDLRMIYIMNKQQPLKLMIKLISLLFREGLDKDVCSRLILFRCTVK